MTHWTESIWPCKQQGATRKFQVLLDKSPWTTMHERSKVSYSYTYAPRLFSATLTQHTVCTHPQIHNSTYTHKHTQTASSLNRRGWHMRQSGGLPMPPCPFCWNWTSPTGWAVNSQYPKNFHTQHICMNTRARTHTHAQLYLDAYFSPLPCTHTTSSHSENGHSAWLFQQRLNHVYPLTTGSFNLTKCLK